MVLVHSQSLVVRPGSSPCIPVPAAPPNPDLAALCLLGANLHTKRCVFSAGQQWHCPGPVFLEAWIENGSLGSHVHKCPPCCSHWLHFGEAAASSCVLRTFSTEMVKTSSSPCHPFIPNTVAGSLLPCEHTSGGTVQPPLRCAA